tara:strand:- start:1115 stop:1660 length:546 start_codon:yes stop_codon:yes gene_type:complete
MSALLACLIAATEAVPVSIQPHASASSATVARAVPQAAAAATATAGEAAVLRKGVMEHQSTFAEHEHQRFKHLTESGAAAPSSRSAQQNRTRTATPLLEAGPPAAQPEDAQRLDAADAVVAKLRQQLAAAEFERESIAEEVSDREERRGQSGGFLDSVLSALQLDLSDDAGLVTSAFVNFV